MLQEATPDPPPGGMLDGGQLPCTSLYLASRERRKDVEKLCLLNSPQLNQISNKYQNHGPFSRCDKILWFLYTGLEIASNCFYSK